MQLNDKVYDALKWFTLIALPAMGTAYLGFAQIWMLPYADQINRSTVVLVLLLGALLGLSTVSFNKSDAKFDGTMNVDSTDPDKVLYSFDLSTDVEELPNKQVLTFKVSNPSP